METLGQFKIALVYGAKEKYAQTLNIRLFFPVLCVWKRASPDAIEALKTYSKAVMETKTIVNYIKSNLLPIYLIAGLLFR